MLEKCICCGEQISAYPCKYCGYQRMIEDVCPQVKGAICQITKKICPNKHNYFNCETLRSMDE